MRSHMVLVAVLIAVAGAMTAGCGKDEAAGPDTAPFTEAVHAYCKAHYMEMMVHKFNSLEVEGDKAAAKVAMRDKTEMYTMSVEWKITFERVNDEWKVTELIR